MNVANGAAPAIEVEGLWQVFGAHAQEALREHRGAGDHHAIADQLKAKGLIPAVREANFKVNAGELFVIMGLSGSGKSTLIRCISRLIEPTAGAVRIDGEDILQANEKRLIELRRHKLGMVFQHFGLFPHMTVTDNVAFPLKMQGAGRSERRNRALEVLKMVGLEGREDSYPRQLSGGQRQRVGIARSLAVNPDIWFLDEPFSALDPLIRRQLQDEFLNIQATLRKSIVFITHDIAEALKLADRIAIMRDGEIVQIGTPTQIVLNPVDDYVREFARDIPKGRHMTLGEVMEPLDGSPMAGDWPELRTGMSLEAALTQCASTFESVPVKDGDGNVVGMVRPDSFVKALGAESG